MSIVGLLYGWCKDGHLNFFFLSLRYPWYRAVPHPFILQPTALSLATSCPSDLATHTTVEMPRTSVLHRSGGHTLTSATHTYTYKLFYDFVWSSVMSEISRLAQIMTATVWRQVNLHSERTQAKAVFLSSGSECDPVCSQRLNSPDDDVTAGRCSEPGAAAGPQSGRQTRQHAHIRSQHQQHCQLSAGTNDGV